MDAALQANLRRAPLPRLFAATDDLLVGHEVRRAAQVGGQLSLRERAKAAAEVTDVRVLDVARDDVGHRVAADFAPQRVGRCEDTVALATACTEEPDELVLAELVTGVNRQRVARHEGHAY